MKPKPFASLNHFTVPFATCKLLLLAGASPLHHDLISGARPGHLGRASGRRIAQIQQKAAGIIPCGAMSNMEGQDQPPGYCLRKEYRSEPLSSQHKSCSRCYSLSPMKLRNRNSERLRVLRSMRIRELGLRLTGSPMDPLISTLHA